MGKLGVALLGCGLVVCVPCLAVNAVFLDLLPDPCSQTLVAPYLSVGAEALVFFGQVGTSLLHPFQVYTVRAAWFGWMGGRIGLGTAAWFWADNWKLDGVWAFGMFFGFPIYCGDYGAVIVNVSMLEAAWGLDGRQRWGGLFLVTFGLEFVVGF